MSKGTSCNWSWVSRLNKAVSRLWFELVTQSLSHSHLAFFLLFLTLHSLLTYFTNNNSCNTRTHTQIHTLQILLLKTVPNGSLWKILIFHATRLKHWPLNDRRLNYKPCYNPMAIKKSWKLPAVIPCGHIPRFTKRPSNGRKRNRHLKTYNNTRYPIFQDMPNRRKGGRRSWFFKNCTLVLFSWIPCIQLLRWLLIWIQVMVGV